MTATGELKKVPVSGGPAVTLCKIPPLFGASWGSTNTIVFAHSNGGLWRVSSDGGAPEALTTLDTKKGEYSHRLPQILPEGNDVIFTIEKAMLRWDNAQVVVRSLVTGEQRVLIEGAADARYVRTGHLVYARMGTLMAVPFDVTRLEVTGGPRGIVDDVMQSVNGTGGFYDTGAAQFSVSESGSLVYVPGGIFPDPETSMVWVDRSGVATPLPVTPRRAWSPRISPDGTQVVFTAQGDRTLWTFDISRKTTSRFSTAGQSAGPIWTPDGTRVTFRSNTTGPDNISWKSADGSGELERLTTNENVQQTPTSWSPDGKTLAFVERSLQNAEALNHDIWILALENGGARARPFIETPFDEQHAEFSPDGRWLAYSSNESGRDEVYVQPYPGPGGKQQVSVGGGVGPAWARNGRELFYAAPGPDGTNKMMAVDVTMGATFTAGTPRVLFEGQYVYTLGGKGYDVTPDGRRFLMVHREQPRPAPPTTMILVQHWDQELKRLVPTR